MGEHVNVHGEQTQGVRSMNGALRGPRGILIVLAVIVVIALALVLRGFLIGDTDNDGDEGFSTGVVITQTA